MTSSLRQTWSAVTCYRFSRSRLVATHPGAAPSRRVTKRRRVAALQIRALPHGRATAPLLHRKPDPDSPLPFALHGPDKYRAARGAVVFWANAGPAMNKQPNRFSQKKI